MQGRRKNAVEHYRQKLIDRNIPLIPLEDYAGCSTKILHRCTVCGYEYKTTPNYVSAGHYCPECGRKKCVETKKANLPSFIDRVAKTSPTVEILGEYKTAHDKIAARCKICGFEWEPYADNLIRGHACPKCTNRINKDPNEFKETVESFGKVKVIGDYISNSHKIKVECVKCGKVWDVYPYSVYIGGGCRECSFEVIGDKARMSHSDFVSLPNIKPSIKIVGKYRGMEKPVECKCDVCGYEWTTAASNVSSGHGCPKCSGRIKTHDEFIDQVKDLSPTIRILGTYSSSNDRINCQCLVCGHLWSPIASSLASGYGCPKCRDVANGERLAKSNEDFIAEINQIHPTIKVLDEYSRNSIRVTCECITCGTKWNPTPSSLLSGHGCPYCNCSHGEREVSNWLKQHGIEYIPQYKFQDLTGLGGGLLSYDFYVPGHKYLIEYQGIQHFEPVEIFGGNDQLEQQREHDKRKRLYAEEHGYKLIEIKYDDNINDKLVFLESVTTTGAMQ